MPIVEIKLIEGRSDQMKEALIRSVTGSVAQSLGVPDSEVVVVLEEMHPQHYAKAGVSKQMAESGG